MRAQRWPEVPQIDSPSPARQNLIHLLARSFSRGVPAPASRADWRDIDNGVGNHLLSALPLRRRFSGERHLSELSAPPPSARDEHGSTSRSAPVSPQCSSAPGQNHLGMSDCDVRVRNAFNPWHTEFARRRSTDIGRHIAAILLCRCQHPCARCVAGQRCRHAARAGLGTLALRTVGSAQSSLRAFRLTHAAGNCPRHFHLFRLHFLSLPSAGHWVLRREKKFGIPAG